MCAHVSSPLPPVYVLGLGLPGPARHETLALPLVRHAEVLIGGKALLASLTDFSGEKLPVEADTVALAARIKANREAGKRQTVLCSGDPLFFGLGARLSEYLGPQALRLVPGTSSLQGAAACLGLPWESIRSVSLHGRSSMLPLAHGLLAGESLFVLTDKQHGPERIAAWMLERGCGHYAMHVLEELRHEPELGVTCARHSYLSLEEALSTAFDAVSPRVLLLVPRKAAPERCFGLREDDLAHEQELVTKLPVRAAALAELGIAPGHVVWDLGAGSGAVALEAAFLAWRGQVLAIERHAGRVRDIDENRRRLAAANLEIVEAHMPDCLEPGSLPRPDRIFLGGGLSGGAESTRQILSLAWQALRPGGRLVAACILLSSLEQARTVLGELGAEVSVTSLQAGASALLAGDVRLKAQNPVFLVLGKKIV